jgi:STE24 endopeptidase
LNIFGIIVLTALIVDYALGLIAGWLNVRSLRLEAPGELKDVYNPDDYRRSQEYTRTTTYFGFIAGSFNLAVILAFWFSGGFNFLDEIVRSWQFPFLITGIFYIVILLAGYSLINLPFTLYHTFVIEQRFGFNRTTRRLFVIDRLKGLFLGLLLGIPLTIGILALLEYGGPFAFLYIWLAVTVISLGVQYIAPIWIMPLFNKYTPMPDGELKKAILDYADSMEFPLQNVFISDSSKRSTRSNAFFTGFGRNKRIVLFDTLIKRHTVPEIVAILAHEIGHYKKRHIIQGTVIGILHFGVLFFLLSIFLESPGLFHAFFINQPSVYSGLIIFSLLYTPVEMLLSIGMNAISRKNESQADRFAVTTTHEPASFASALKKLSSDNLSNLTPHPFYVFMNYSHPPLRQRIQTTLSGKAA